MTKGKQDVTTKNTVKNNAKENADERAAETLRQNVDDAISATQKNNVGEPLRDDGSWDSVIRDSKKDAAEQKADIKMNDAIKGVWRKPKDEDLSEAERTEKDFYGSVRRQKAEHERQSAVLKFSFMLALAILVVGLAVVQNSNMPWNVESRLAAINQNAEKALPAAQNATFDTNSETDGETGGADESEPQTAVKSQKTVAAVADNNELNNQKTASSAENQSQAAITWQLPVYGKIIKGYGYSYDETWKDYRFHSGVDIALEKGEEVFALADGRVTEKGKTKALGEYLRIDYGGNLVGYYYGISLKKELAVGGSIKSGQTLGTVTDPPLQESAEVPHYHFALLQDGKTVDPVKLMK